MQNFKALKEHIKSHKEVQEHLCEECGKSCNSVNSLADHKLSHNPVRQFQCTKCVSRFYTQRNYLK